MDERVNIVVDAFRTTIEHVNLIAVFIVILIFVLIAFFLFFWEKFEEFISQRYMKRLFFRNGEAYGLTRKELEILWEYSHKTHKDPFLVLEYKAPFEKVVQAYIENNPDFDEKLIKNMRKKLGFDKIPPFMPLISTKDIDLFQTGNLLYQNRTFPVALYDKDEKYMYWYLIDQKPPFPFKEGDNVKIKFIREDDAIYLIDGRIEEIFEEDGKYIIKIPHTFKFLQIQRRKDFRVKKEIPLILETYDINGNKVKKEFKTTDISIDGIGFCIPIKEARNLKMNIGAEINLVLEFEDVQIPVQAVIKNIREIGKNICYGAEFKDLKGENKNFIIKFVQAEQQKLLKEYRRLKLFE
ncbi:PilZ domain-containing protein [Persephonella sp. KM09-Lau-8]|uniref:flagellar brake protein n=1 Tax=Persephonella sp. KM09-Lau-8 TaxID=1158345 RepID=UPI000496BC46|nr:PilZ domain-containing protein [Persephonella sp. KM09-Lau-8]